MKNKKLLFVIIIIILTVTTFIITKQKSQFSPSTKVQAYTRVSPPEAIETIRNLTEIKQWESSLNREESKPVISIESETDYVYMIHVYESKLEDIITFGWYDVDKIKGNVTKSNP